MYPTENTILTHIKIPLIQLYRLLPYICTIQKFCDREDDKIGLINDRSNIICFSDEAHRTQLEHAKKIQFSKDSDENMKGSALLWKQMEEEGHVYFIAYKGDEPCGYVSVQPQEDAIFHLQKIYVLPAFQGQHLGSFLFRQAIPMCWGRWRRI